MASKDFEIPRNVVTPTAGDNSENNSNDGRKWPQHDEEEILDRTNSPQRNCSDRETTPDPLISKQNKFRVVGGRETVEPPPTRHDGRNQEEERLSIEAQAAKQDTVPRARTQSLIQSLPVAEAEPETTRVESVLAYASKVEPITDFRRVAGNKPAIDNEDQNRPALISVRIRKHSATMKLGIVCRLILGEVKITNIDPTSPLADTPLRPGDRLISLDHHSTNHFTAAQATNYLQNTEGLICFVARTKNGDSNVAEAAVYKSSVDEHVGISFRNENGRLRISNINSGGLLGEMSVLKSGDFVETINSMDVSQIDAALALDIVRSSLGLVTFRIKNTDTINVSLRDMMMTNISSRSINGPIVAADELESLELGTRSPGDQSSEIHIRPGFISVRLYKPSLHTKLGITFMNHEDELRVCTVTTNSMLAKSPIAAGMKILSIGNIPCHKWTTQQALNYLKARMGEIVFVVQNPLGDSSYAAAMAFKPTAWSQLGISFKTTGRSLKVGNILPEGLFYNSVVNCGDSVIAINNVPCEYMTPSEAVTLTKQYPDIIVLLTKPHCSAAVVLSHIASMHGCDEYGNARGNVTLQNHQDPRFRSCFASVFCVVALISISAILMVTNKNKGCEINGIHYDDDYFCQ